MLAGMHAWPIRASLQQRFQKSTSFLLFFFSSALAHRFKRFDDAAETSTRRHCLPPVRQLKIFYRPAVLPTPLEQKCANLLCGLIAMHASTHTEHGMHRTRCRMIATGNTAENFSPAARQILTNDSRQKSVAPVGGRAVAARSIVAANTPTAATRHQRDRRRPTDGAPIADGTDAGMVSLHR
ncbi:hypothetical protein [Xanthomonas nasturtii]|uniref:hypothetical protein n=1 Tax=Xanthomonas nasturtii TaxID=1843581 RepID=UPI002012FF0B|nr:hypothetical protein [Xanthomonas nasturtii]MCL1525534.1 hypothetical protein [Xanthomonas nasturtii]MCL1534400.1 hypothetical protein [Xanthomonas nasturtii]MCL1542871.1 hypothetical protein [Xanthomonas nasturtii]MCL1558240.1 hypothetical protein [Xanthomonas nasturtii]